MRIFFRRILIFVLVAALFFTNINISVAASGIGKESFYQMKNEQEDTQTDREYYNRKSGEYDSHF